MKILNRANSEVELQQFIPSMRAHDPSVQKLNSVEGNEAVRRMKYAPQHAKKALEIMRRLLPQVSPREEYLVLISILEKPERWREAHDQFSKIRTNITLPFERQKKNDSDAYFACVAECAAKTAYNCSGESAPFDEDSFEWLLRCEKEFIEKKTKANQSAAANALDHT